MKEINNANINYGILTSYINNDDIKHILCYGKDLLIGSINGGYTNTGLLLSSKFLDNLAKQVKECSGEEWGPENPILTVKINGLKITLTHETLGYHNMTNICIAKLDYL